MNTGEDNREVINCLEQDCPNLRHNIPNTANP